MIRKSILRNILPAEGQLQSVLNVRARCITETENLVKMVMKSTNSEGLSKCGVAGIDKRVNV
jgi:hypothetical protein